MNQIIHLNYLIDNYFLLIKYFYIFMGETNFLKVCDLSFGLTLIICITHASLILNKINFI